MGIVFRYCINLKQEIGTSSNASHKEQHSRDKLNQLKMRIDGIFKTGETNLVTDHIFYCTY
jgi:hypothetical protein